MIQLFEKNNMKKYILIIISIFIHFAFIVIGTK